MTFVTFMEMLPIVLKKSSDSHFPVEIDFKCLETKAVFIKTSPRRSYLAANPI